MAPCLYRSEGLVVTTECVGFRQEFDRELAGERPRETVKGGEGRGGGGEAGEIRRTPEGETERSFALGGERGDGGRSVGRSLASVGSPNARSVFTWPLLKADQSGSDRRNGRANCFVSGGRKLKNSRHRLRGRGRGKNLNGPVRERERERGENYLINDRRSAYLEVKNWLQICLAPLANVCHELKSPSSSIDTSLVTPFAMSADRMHSEMSHLGQKMQALRLGSRYD